MDSVPLAALLSPSSPTAVGTGNGRLFEDYFPLLTLWHSAAVHMLDTFTCSTEKSSNPESVPSSKSIEIQSPIRKTPPSQARQGQNWRHLYRGLWSCASDRIASRIPYYLGKSRNWPRAANIVVPWVGENPHRHPPLSGGGPHLAACCVALSRGPWTSLNVLIFHTDSTS